MSCALPSLRTVQRFIKADYRFMHEDGFRFDQLLVHLKALNCPKVVSVTEDATRAIKKVQYDVETDRLVGFVLSCDEKGLLLTDSNF